MYQFDKKVIDDFFDCHFYCILEDGTTRKISSFGNGVQAIITMFSAIP